MMQMHRNMLEYLRYIKYCLYAEYIYIYSAFVDLDNKLYKMHGAYIRNIILLSSRHILVAPFFEFTCFRPLT